MRRRHRCFGLVLPLLFTCGCSDGPGDRTASSSRAEPITGGVQDSGGGAHPAVVMLTHGGGACTGTLIAPNLVLTARHCVSQNISQGIGCDIYGGSTNGDHVGNDYTPNTIQVFTGVQPQFWGTPVAVGSQVLHPPGKNLCNNDIALIVLNTAVGGVTPMMIRRDYPPQIGELTTAVGYGAINENQMGSGTRRRRENVPVVSVGPDWNEIIGNGELAAGQAVCSGDSGGPIISGGGAVLGVASRVSNCSDPAATAKYVRLDYHKDLINQAFAAAGATPVLDTSAPPPPPTKKQTGEGPCTTGAQCQNLLCNTTAGYCTEFCGSSACPSGSYCADTTIVIGGQSITEKMCTLLPTGTACEQCRATECVNVVSTCLANAECQALLACADACTDAACITSCEAAHPAGFDDYDSVEYCACNSSCAGPCANLCATATGGGGGGGAAGAGAVGGGGSGGSGGGGTGATGGGLTGGFGGSIGGADGGTPTTSGSSGDSGGCSFSSSRGADAPLWVLISALLLARRRRR